MKRVVFSVFSISLGAYVGSRYENWAREKQYPIGRSQRSVNYCESSESESGYEIENTKLFPYFIPKVSAASSLTTYTPSSVPQSSTVTEVMKFGFPSLENIRSFDGFVLAYDKRNRIPYWVFEKISAAHVKKGVTVDRTNCQFHDDKLIHKYFKATNKDYKNSGYDRGHLAAAGNHKWSQKSMEQTFILSNMAPQVLD